MIDPKASADVKLETLRQLFSDATDHLRRARGEMHRASRFYHNTYLEGQWEWDDLQALRDDGRPAFSFNMIAPKLRSWIGQYEDGKRRPEIVPKQGEDKLRAELLERICDSVYADLDVEDVDEQVMELGIQKGEANWMLSVEPDPEMPSYIRFDLGIGSPHDVSWDPGSRDESRKDACHVFAAKWMTKSEFTVEYPEHRDAWDDLEDAGGSSSTESISTQNGEMAPHQEHNDQYKERSEDAYFFDRHKHRIRIVHCEYEVPVQKTHAINPMSGESTMVEPEELELIQEAVRLGQLPPVEIVTVWDTEVYTVEFVGSKILYESTGEMPYQPFQGYSVVPFTCHLDQESLTPYGMVRNLFDPQMEINKARSVTLEQLADQPKPGFIYEEGAVKDSVTFDNQLHTSGENAVVEDGAISGGRIQQLQLPQVSPASVERLQASMELFDRAANIETEVGNPTASVEAATTHMIRWHRSRQGQRPIIANFERGQRRVKQKIVQAIVAVMPDAQMEAILSGSEEWIVREGVAMKLEPGPDGQLQPTAQVPLRDVRQTRYDVMLETHSENVTLNMVEHQGLMALHTSGVPVPPDLLAEGATTSRAKRDQLRRYARETSQQQAQMAQQMQEAEIAKLQGVLNVENMKTAEDARHNREQEFLDFMELVQKGNIEALKIWEKADQAEKDRLMAMYQSLQQQRAGGAPSLQVIPGGV